MDNKFSFSLAFSIAELSWLAGAFGTIRLSLPCQLPVFSPAQLRAAQDSLSARGIIQREPGQGWKTDRLAAFIVRRLGDAENYMRVDIRERNAIHRAGIYVQKEISMLAWCDQDQVEFVFYPPSDSIVAELLRRLDLETVRAGKGEHLAGTIGCAGLVDVIRAAWQDTGPAGRALANAGLSKRETASALKWMESLKLVVTFSVLEKDQLFLCSDGKSLWTGTSDKFLPCTSDDAARQIEQIL
jgi:hypothetical protein